MMLAATVVLSSREIIFFPNMLQMTILVQVGAFHCEFRSFVAVLTVFLQYGFLLLIATPHGGCRQSPH
jgi:hypothetical protein